MVPLAGETYLDPSLVAVRSLVDVSLPQHGSRGVGRVATGGLGRAASLVAGAIEPQRRTWSPLFFWLREPGWAFVEIVLLWLAVAVTLVRFFPERCGGLAGFWCRTWRGSPSRRR